MVRPDFYMLIKENCIRNIVVMRNYWSFVVKNKFRVWSILNIYGVLMIFNDVFFVMQKQSGGITPGSMKNHELDERCSISTPNNAKIQYFSF